MDRDTGKTSTDGYGRFNHTLQECRKGLESDIAEFGSRYSLLSKALELLDTGKEELVELVRTWFDVYMSIFDEASFEANSATLEALELQILKYWYTLTKR